MSLFKLGACMLAAACVLVFSSESQVLARKAPQSRPDVMLSPGDMDWATGPGYFPKGAEISALEGDPAMPGPFTIRLKFPSGYFLPPHRHITAERLTVISGVLLLGPGTVPDKQKTKPMGAGSFATMSANNFHYAYADGVTVIQLHGRGPLQIIYANPADDPRKK